MGIRRPKATRYSHFIPTLLGLFLFPKHKLLIGVIVAVIVHVSDIHRSQRNEDTNLDLRSEQQRRRRARERTDDATTHTNECKWGLAIETQWKTDHVLSTSSLLSSESGVGREKRSAGKVKEMHVSVVLTLSGYETLTCCSTC